MHKALRLGFHEPCVSQRHRRRIQNYLLFAATLPIHAELNCIGSPRDLGLASGLALAVSPPVRLTVPESVGRRCAQLRAPGADLTLGPRLVHRAMTLWMQTTGAALLAVEWCSLARVRMAAQDSRSAHGLLYLAAVWG
jgi:hypothetical protein